MKKLKSGSHKLNIFSVQNRFPDVVNNDVIRRNLNIILIGAALGSIWFNISSGAALTGLATELGANALVFGILMALPVAAGLVQILASSLVERTGQRKRIFLVFGIIHRACWLGVAAAPWIFPHDLLNTRLWAVIVIVTLSSIAGAYVNVSYYSMYGDILPESIRGRFISFRSRVATLFALSTGIFVAIMLDSIPGFPGYTIVFAISGISGICDISFYKFVRLPEMKKAKVRTSFFKNVRFAMSSTVFRRSLFFWTAWLFTFNISQVFIIKYMLENMHLSFTVLTLAGQITSNIAAVIFVSKWGTFIDKYGNKALLYVSCTITSLSMLVWVFAEPGSFIVPLIFNIVYGIFWSSIDVSNQSMIISHSPAENKSIYVAVYFAFTSLFGTAIAYIAGGFLLEKFNNFLSAVPLRFAGISIDNYKLLFILSAILRLAAIFIFLPRVQEDKDSKSLVTWKSFLSGN